MTQVIVLNGGSSSGKSSIARALQDVLPGPWLTFGTDVLAEALPGRGDDPRSGLMLEPDGTVTVKPEFWAVQRLLSGISAGQSLVEHARLSVLVGPLVKQVRRRRGPGTVLPRRMPGERRSPRPAAACLVRHVHCRWVDVTACNGRC